MTDSTTPHLRVVRASRAVGEPDLEPDAGPYPLLPGEYDAVVEWVRDFASVTLDPGTEYSAEECAQFRPGIELLVELAEGDRDQMCEDWAARTTFITADPVVLAETSRDTAEQLREHQQRERDAFVAGVARRMRELLSLAADAHALDDVLRAVYAPPTAL